MSTVIWFGRMVFWIFEIYRARLKANAEKSGASIQEIAIRMASIEERMANIETIILEQEKSRKFSDL